MEYLSRMHSHAASSSQLGYSQLAPKAFRSVGKLRFKRHVVCRALFDPPPFRPDKLTITYQDACWLPKPSNNNCIGNGPSAGLSHFQRRYTLTHNDLTGDLQLTVGKEYNYTQISGLYTRLLRDEVIAEWHFGSRPTLHVYCHVSGEERWLAPPVLRNYIFRRELPLVLDTFTYADREFLAQHPELNNAEVYVHFQSSQQDLDTVEIWGILGSRSTWQPVPTSVIKRLVMAITGQAADSQQPQEVTSRDWQSQQSQPTVSIQHSSSSVLQPQSQQQDEQLTLGPGVPAFVPVVAAMDISSEMPLEPSISSQTQPLNTVLVPPTLPDSVGSPSSLYGAIPIVDLTQMQQQPALACVSTLSNVSTDPGGGGKHGKPQSNGASGNKDVHRTDSSCDGSGAGAGSSSSSAMVSNSNGSTRLLSSNGRASYMPLQPVAVAAQQGQSNDIAAKRLNSTSMPIKVRQR